MSDHIETGSPHAWHKSGRIQAKYSAVLDSIMEERGNQKGAKYWDVTRPEPVGRQKLFACRWRYINGRLICR